MPRLTVVHLSGPRAGETDVVEEFPAVIGSQEGAGVRVPGAAPRHALLLQRDEGIILEEVGTGRDTYLAGQPVREAVIHDGDVVTLGAGGPELRFEHGAAPPPAVRRRRFPRASSGFKRSVALTISIGVVLFAWSYQESRRLEEQVGALRRSLEAAERERQRLEASVAEERLRAEAEREAFEARLAEDREREEALRRQLAEAASGEVAGLRQELQAARDRLKSLESERAAAERIIRTYGAGVCLVQGSYAFHDASGRPLRRRLDEEGRPARGEDGSLELNVDFDGPVHTVSYFGTGFLVDRSGLVLTNRHVAEPWGGDETAQAIARAGFAPRFVALRAFFPRIARPFALAPHRAAEGVDLAVLRIDVRGARIPVLPLDRTGRGAVPGHPVVVVGYPTGLEAILAKADAGVVREILAAHGTSAERVTDALAEKGLIRPSTTQGHIGDVTRTDVVFDAPTTAGGSGGPVFNKEGLVIAVEYAVLQKFGGNSFGVPASYALRLLRPPRRRSGEG